jgi:predicted ATP-dependent protease
MFDTPPKRKLEPEPVPLDVKIVLLGDRLLFYLLESLDADFPALFKVMADFEDDVERTPENDLLYARLVAAVVRDEKLRPFHRSAVARVIEQGARLAEDSEKVSAHMGKLIDLLRESSHWAGERKVEQVSAEDVDRAIATQELRAGRVRERVLEQIQHGTLLIQTDGSVVGQVNGLSVIELGGQSFGRPSRITARVRLGRGEVIDIEREVELGGPIHSKGVLILSGLLGSRWARDIPLSLSATLVFEQSYGHVEGDSASCAELYALLSALADVPVRHSIGITGSVNQHGEVQPIGGVNEKIEGFFDVCRARGLRGDQGVIVPRSNVRHLMLRKDVIAAVREKQFAIWAIGSIDEGTEILTGMAAPAFNAKVEARLATLAALRRASNAPPEH